MLKRALLNPKARWLTASGLLVAGLAWASPWDIDMVDSAAVKAYESPMRHTRIEGTIQRAQGGIPRAKPAGGYQNDYIAPLVNKDGPEVDALVNPFAGDAAHIEKGQQLFRASCATCHGLEGKGGGPTTYNKPDPDPAKAIRRFNAAAPLLSGKGAVTATRSDGHIYATIRYGRNNMQAYATSLTDEERWSVIAYLRSLDGAQYTPPAAPAPAAPAAPADGAAAGSPAPSNPSTGG